MSPWFVIGYASDWYVCRHQAGRESQVVAFGPMSDGWENDRRRALDRIAGELSQGRIAATGAAVDQPSIPVLPPSAATSATERRS